MILWGREKRKLSEGELKHVVCPSCHSKTSMWYEVFATYLHIFWIPTCPLSKKKYLECATCAEQFRLKELPENIKQEFKNRVRVKYPLWYFSGLAGIIILGYTLSILFADREIKDQNLIDNPQIGDIYTIKVDQEKAHINDYSSHYTLMKVIDVSNDSATVMYNTKTVKKVYKSRLIDKASYFDSTLTNRFSLPQLKEFYETNYIKTVNRN